MPDQWNYADLINLEYFLELDAARQEEKNSLQERDRSFFLKHCTRENGQAIAEKTCLHHWLGFRCDRETRRDGMLPGQIYGEVFRLLQITAAAGGALAGLGIASAMLSYSGTEPVNVFTYLVFFVLLPVVFLVVLPAAFLLKGRLGKVQRFPLLYSLVASLFEKILVRASSKFTKSLSGPRRKALRSIRGIIKGKNRIYGRLFYWPLAWISQLFTVSFHVGVLVVTLFFVLTRDIAFGWQSTLQISSEGVYGFVRMMALPWSWVFGSGVGYPSLDQINGSHIILKDGIYHLQTGNLVAWWPFLILAVLTYALLPRLLLLLACNIMERKDLAAMDLCHAPVKALLQRMRTPRVRTSGRKQPEVKKVAPIVVPEKQKEKSEPEKQQEKQTDIITVLVPDAVYDECSGKVFDDFLLILTGLPSGVDKFRYDAGFEEDEAMLISLRDVDWKNRPSIVVVAEAYMPPIQDILTLFIDLRKTAGDGVDMVVALIGKPEETIFTAPLDTDVAIWRDKLQSLGDPWLRVEPFTGEHNG